MKNLWISIFSVCIAMTATSGIVFFATANKTPAAQQRVYISDRQAEALEAHKSALLDLQRSPITAIPTDSGYAIAWGR